MVKVYTLPSAISIAIIGGCTISYYLCPIDKILGWGLSLIWGVIMGVIYGKITCRSNAS